MDPYEQFGGGPTADDITNYYAKILLLKELRKGNLIISHEEAMDYENHKERLVDRILYRSTPEEGMELMLTGED